uniref:Uncharacterized protein n=1 Tax=Oryza rufipogon TaxID=4529 RepID=A0A0E0P5H3_ORYRU
MPKPNPRAASSSAAAAVSSPDAGRKEREENTVPAVYDASADIEDDYRLFLENVRVYENEDFVLEYEGKVVRYGGDEAVSAGGGSRGEDPVMEEEKEKEKEVDVVVISSSSDDESTKIVSEPNPLDRGVFQRKMKKVVDKEKMDEKNEAAAPLVKGKGVGKVIGMEVEDEQLVLALPKPGTTTSLTNPSKRHETEPYTTSQSAGIIWPPHINDREESSFKQGLMEALSKPFCQEEYDNFKQGLIEVLSKPFCQEEHDELYGMATIREPSMSERRTRSGSKTYYSNLGWANHILIPTQVWTYVSSTCF